MQTVYDWLTVALFAGLVVLFLQRSMAPEEERDRAIHYIPPAIGCAVANYLGNHGMDLAAIATLILAGAYSAWFLRIWPWAKQT